MAARNTTYGRMKSRPPGCAPSRLPFPTGWIAGSGGAPRTEVMASVLGQEFVGSCGRFREGLVDRLVVEHHRPGPGIAERLPDLGGAGHVRNLHHATRLVRELPVGRVLGEVARVDRGQVLPHGHLTGQLEQPAVRILAGRELHEVPSGEAV